MIIKINFSATAAYILWFGTHKEYDNIDVKLIRFKKITMEQYKILRSEADYHTTIDRTIGIFDAEPGTPDFEELEVLLLLVKDYEDKHYQIPTPDPIEAIKAKMDRMA